MSTTAAPPQSPTTATSQSVKRKREEPSLLSEGHQVVDPKPSTSSPQQKKLVVEDIPSPSKKEHRVDGFNTAIESATEKEGQVNGHSKHKNSETKETDASHNNTVPQHRNSDDTPAGTKSDDHRTNETYNHYEKVKPEKKPSAFGSVSSTRTFGSGFGQSSTFGALASTATPNSVSSSSPFAQTSASSVVKEGKSLSSSPFAQLASSSFGALPSASTSFATVAQNADSSSFKDLLSKKKGKVGNGGDDAEGKEEGVDNGEQEETEFAPIVKLAPVNVKTGEEDEVTVFRSKANLKIFDSDNQQWKQRGFGSVHVNVGRVDANGQHRARIVMRNSGTLALLMNVLVFPTMSIRLVQDRTIIIGAIEHGKIVSYALRMENASTAMEIHMLLERAKDPQELVAMMDDEDAIAAWEEYEAAEMAQKQDLDKEHE